MDLYQKYNAFLSDTEKSYDGYIFMVYTDDPEMKFVYCSDDWGKDIKSFAGIGVNPEDIINRKELKNIEDMLEEELPKIGKSIPEVISGPHYKGVWQIGRGAYTLSVITECREENIRHVQRKVNRAILELFDEKGIRLS